MKRIDWFAVAFGVLFGMWVAADQYVGFNFAVQTPVSLALMGLAPCLLAIFLIALRDGRAALLTFIIGFLLLIVTDRVWKYFIPSGDPRKLFAVGLLEATPLIAALGAFCFWRAWRRAGRTPARSESAPSVLSR